MTWSRKPTAGGAGGNRLDTCTELIGEARKCLGSGDRECVLRKIEELVGADCHNGYAVGKEIANGVREIVHKLWLVSSGDNEYKCRLLMMLRDLDVSRNWVRSSFNINTKKLNNWLRRCGISWKDKTARYEVVKEIEDLLRRLGWSEVRMCEELWRFVGVDVNEFRKYGMEPCIWLNGLETLSDLRNPYWLGLRASDLAVRRRSSAIELIIDTTNSIDAVFFAKILEMIETPSIRIEWIAVPDMKHVSKSIGLSFYIALGINEWPWPIELSAGELERILDGFSDEELAMFVAGLIDGDGTVLYRYDHESKTEFVLVMIAACKACPKRTNLDVLKKVIARRFGINGNIHQFETADALVFYNRNAVRLLRRIAKYVHHPLRRLRAELILALYDGRISREAFEKLYEMTEYELGGPDVKRNHALEAIIRAAPQTHTHGG